MITQVSTKALLQFMHGFFVQLEGLPYTYTLICNTPESGNNAILEAPPDLRPPVSKRHKGIGTVQCYTSPFEHLVFLFFLDLTGLALSLIHI